MHPFGFGLAEIIKVDCRLALVSIHEIDVCDENNIVGNQVEIRQGIRYKTEKILKRDL